MEKGEKSNILALNFNKAWNFRPNPESNSNWVKKVDEKWINEETDICYKTLFQESVGMVSTEQTLFLEPLELIEAA